MLELFDISVNVKSHIHFSKLCMKTFKHWQIDVIIHKFQNIYTDMNRLWSIKKKFIHLEGIIVICSIFWSASMVKMILMTGALLEISIHGCHNIICHKFCGCLWPCLFNKTQNFAGAKIYILKFCGCQAPVVPVLTRPLLCPLVFVSPC